MDLRFPNEEGKEICHILYADDTIIFCEPTVDKIRFIRLILILFESALGFESQSGKEQPFPVLEVSQVQSLANILGCRIENTNHLSWYAPRL